MSMLNMVRLPLIFISGVFIPVESIPSIGQVAAYISPLTYGNDLIRAAYIGDTRLNPLIDVAMLCIFILLFQIIANRLYKRFNE
jgi:ABC-2 type transport system permease protein